MGTKMSGSVGALTLDTAERWLRGAMPCVKAKRSFLKRRCQAELGNGRQITQVKTSFNGDYAGKYPHSLFTHKKKW